MRIYDFIDYINNKYQCISDNTTFRQHTKKLISFDSKIDITITIYFGEQTFFHIEISDSNILKNVEGYVYSECTNLYNDLLYMERQHKLDIICI